MSKTLLASSCEAGHQTDELVGQVLGWKPPKGWRYVFAMLGNQLDLFCPPRFSTQMAAAWRIVEAMRLSGYDFELTYENRTWECWFPHAVYDAGHALADTAPLAICRACLKALAPDGAARA